MFRFFLAHQLNRTLDDIQNMTLLEYAGWQIYFDMRTPQPEAGRHDKQAS